MAELQQGTRAVQLLKPVLTALKMIPITEAVIIPFFTKHIDEQGKFNPIDSAIKAAEGMFTELAKWSENLKGVRR